MLPLPIFRARPELSCGGEKSKKEGLATNRPQATTLVRIESAALACRLFHTVILCCTTGDVNSPENMAGARLARRRLKASAEYRDISAAQRKKHS